eukprot:scpid45946/ scgid10824/ Transducin beta-like protein 3; WD repeat-containing protein SAZD
MDPSILRTSYDVQRKIGAFYTGGRVAVSRDEKYLYCSCGTAVNVVEIDTGNTTCTFEADDEDPLTTFAVSPDNSLLVTCGQSMLLRLWSLSTLTSSSTSLASWRIPGGAPVCVGAFDSTSSSVALGTTRGTVQVWDAVKRYCTHNFKGVPGLVGAVAFHPAGSQLYSSGADGIINVWDLAKSQRVMQLKGHMSAVPVLRFVDGEGKLLISGGRDQIVHVWECVTGRSRKTIPVFEFLDDLIPLRGDSIFPGCKSTERKQSEACFFTAGSKGILRVWTISGKCVYDSSKADAAEANAAATPTDHHLLQVFICAERQQVASVTFDHTITFHRLTERDLPVHKHMSGFNEEILAVKTIGDSDQVAIATNSDTLRVVNVTTQDVQILHGHSDGLMAVDACADGSWLATCSKDQTVRVWTRSSGESTRFECVGVGRGHTAAVGSVVCSLPEATAPFLVSAARDCTLKVWEVQHAVYAGGRAHDQRIPSLDVRFTQQAHAKDVNALAISPKNQLIATAGADKIAKVWSASDGTLQGVLRGHRRGVWSVAFSPLDRAVATASADASVRLWSLQHMTCMRTFEGHANSALNVIFMSRGTQLCSAGGDGFLKVWNVHTGDLACSLDGHDDRVWAVCASNDGESLVSGGSDSTLVVWRNTTQEVAQRNKDKEAEQVLAQQELNNLLANKLYTKAVQLALRLDQPFRLLGVVKSILELPEDVDSAAQLDIALANLREDQLVTLLRYVATWNTNAHHSRAAQAVLQSVFRRYHPRHLCDISDVGKSVEPLVSYTERHAARVSHLLKQAAFLDFTWESMRQ